MVEPMRLPAVQARVGSWRTTTWWGWAGRYVPPEVSGLITALIAGVTAGRITGAPSAATLAGSLGETVGYYAAAGLLEARRQRGRACGEAGRAAVVARTVRGLLVEFGPADLLDTLLVRPAFMYAGQLVTGDLVLGLVAGKVAADVVFYAVVIPCYQFRKHVLRDTGAPDVVAVRSHTERPPEPAHAASAQAPART